MNLEKKRADDKFGFVNIPNATRRTLTITKVLLNYIFEQVRCFSLTVRVASKFYNVNSSNLTDNISKSKPEKLRSKMKSQSTESSSLDSLDCQSSRAASCSSLSKYVKLVDDSENVVQSVERLEKVDTSLSLDSLESELQHASLVTYACFYLARALLFITIFMFAADALLLYEAVVIRPYVFALPYIVPRFYELKI